MASRSTTDSRPRKTVGGEMKRVGLIPLLMLLASLVALGLGTFFWLRASSSAPDPQGAPHLAAERDTAARAAGASVDRRLRTGLADGAPHGGAGETAAVTHESPTADGSARATEPAGSPSGSFLGSSTLMRVGGSFAVAFIVAFLLRSFVRIGLIVAAVVAGGLYLLERTGVIGVDWTMFQRGAGDAADWVGDRSDEIWAFVKTAVPSGAAAAIGFWSGFRRG